MLQVNPVLSDSTATPQSTSNINASGVDSRRYTKFDRSASEVQTAENFSFSDFLDMVNPLQHIPVISSAYRAIAGEDIHPAARVAGDIIYGGVAGVASGVIAIAGSTSDSLMEAETGHDATGHVVLAMLGEDEGKSMIHNTPEAAPQMVADANTAVQQQIQQMPQATASQAMPQQAMPTWQNARFAEANKSVPVIPANTTPTHVAVADESAGNTPDDAPVNALNAKPALKPLREDKTYNLVDRSAARAFPLSPNRLPYGGVMAPVQTASAPIAAAATANQKTPVADAIARMDAAIKQQNRLISLVQNSHDMRSSTTIETNPNMPGNHPILNTPTQTTAPALPATPKVVAMPTTPVETASTNNSGNSAGGGAVRDWGQDDRTLSGGLTNDALLLRALGQYQNTVSRSPDNGNHIDLMN